MTEKEQQRNKDYQRLKNYYIAFIAISITIFCLFHINLVYVVLHKESTISAPDVSLIAITIIINLGLMGKLNSFSITKSGFVFDFVQKVESEINQIQKKVNRLEDQLMTAAILDGYEFCTLMRLNEQANSLSRDEKFQYNFHADLQLRHLYNIGFIKIKTEGRGYDEIKQSNGFKEWLKGLNISNFTSNFYDQKAEFEPRDYFIITERGEKYLEIHAKSDLKTPVIDEHNQLFFLTPIQYNIYESLTKENFSKQKAIEIANKNNNSN